LYHSTLGLRVTKRKMKKVDSGVLAGALQRLTGLTREQLLYRNVQRSRGGLVSKAHRLLYAGALVRLSGLTSLSLGDGKLSSAGALSLSGQNHSPTVGF